MAGYAQTTAKPHDTTAASTRAPFRPSRSFTRDRLQDMPGPGTRAATLQAMLNQSPRTQGLAQLQRAISQSPRLHTPARPAEPVRAEHCLSIRHGHHHRQSRPLPRRQERHRSRYLRQGRHRLDHPASRRDQPARSERRGCRPGPAGRPGCRRLQVVGHPETARSQGRGRQRHRPQPGRRIVLEVRQSVRWRRTVSVASMVLPFESCRAALPGL
jgi:hypothetical protein